MPRHEIHPASGRSYVDLRAEALALRALYTPVAEIAARLGVAWTTARAWAAQSPAHAAACRHNWNLRAAKERAREDRVHAPSGRLYADLKREAIALRNRHMKTPAIAARLDLPQGTISKWVRYAPGHAAACKANAARKADGFRLYPAGHAALRRRLATKGVPPRDRILIVKRVAESRAEARP